MYKVEDKPIVRTSTKGSPIRDAIMEALTNLEVGKSFEVPNKGQLATAMKLAKTLGLEGVTSTTNDKFRVGMVDPASVKPRKAKKTK